MTSGRRLSVVALALALAACATDVSDPALEGEIPFRPERPALPEPSRPAAYTGRNPAVLEAQEKLTTGLDLHAKVIYRTCSPNGGVCHNNKEYPDLRTPANFLASIEAPCNVQPGTPEAAYDRCERPGDRFKLGGEPEREIGWIKHVAGERPMGGPTGPDSPGLHVRLAEPIGGGKKELTGTGRFIRTFVNARGAVEDLPFAAFDTRWTLLEDGRHLVGDVRADRVTQVQQLVTVGIVQGDHNRNGKFGARERPPVPLLRVGKPEESYLIARLRGVMGGEKVPGTRMPLANTPLSVSEMLALFCFTEGLAREPQPPNLASAIDYARCSYSADPESLNLLGAGVTWARRVKNILEFNCGGCHSGAEPQGALDLKDGDVYKRLIEERSRQRTQLAFIKPGAPAESYLWLKLVGDPKIMGLRMPFNPLTGQGKLSDAELADVKAWIEAGAVENE